MLLMQEILVKKTSSSLYGNIQHLPTRIQLRNGYVKLRWFGRHFPDHEVIVEIDNSNSIHAFHRFEMEGHAERKYNHFRLLDLTREELYAMGLPVIFDEEQE